MAEADPRPEDAAHLAGYTPLLSAEYAERIRQWHENAYQATKTAAGRHGRTSMKDGWSVDYFTFRVPP